MITDLLNQDQLTQEIKSKNAFLDFLEAPITFQPTYKYDIGTSIYDSSEKKRPPAWCDRILYHIPKNPTDVEIIEYNSIDSVTTSDHKPVFLNLNVSLREIDAIKFESCLADLTRLLDKIENDNIPDVKISTNLLEYGQIRFLDPVIKTINIENVGKSIANVKFLECKKWIVLNPSSTSLLPGENITIDVLINIDSLTASEFNSGIPSQDILILHIEQSRDFFIDVMCDWEKSCFGAELSDLCQGEKSLPKQLWRIIDFLYKHGKDIVY